MLAGVNRWRQKFFGPGLRYWLSWAEVFAQLVSTRNTMLCGYTGMQCRQQVAQVFESFKPGRTRRICWFWTGQTNNQTRSVSHEFGEKMEQLLFASMNVPFSVVAHSHFGCIANNRLECAVISFVADSIWLHKLLWIWFRVLVHALHSATRASCTFILPLSVLALPPLRWIWLKSNRDWRLLSQVTCIRADFNRSAHFGFQRINRFAHAYGIFARKMLHTLVFASWILPFHIQWNGFNLWLHMQANQ